MGDYVPSPITHLFTLRATVEIDSVSRGICPRLCPPHSINVLYTHLLEYPRGGYNISGCSYTTRRSKHLTILRKEVNQMKKVKIQIRKLEKIETTGARHAQGAG